MRGPAPKGIAMRRADVAAAIRDRSISPKSARAAEARIDT